MQILIGHQFTSLVCSELVAKKLRLTQSKHKPSYLIQIKYMSCCIWNWKMIGRDVLTLSFA